MACGLVSRIGVTCVVAPSAFDRKPGEARLSRSTPPDSTSFSSRLRRSRPSQPTYSVTVGRAPPPNCTRRAVAMSPATLVGSKSTPHDFSSLTNSGLTALGGAMPIGPGRAAHLGNRIDERQHLAAPEHVLVDGVGGLGREPVGLGDHQHVDVGRDLLDILRQRLDVEEVADLLHDHLRRLLPATAHHGHRIHGPPSSGRLVMRPTTRFLGLASVKISLVRSYSRKASRSVVKNGMVASVSVELLPTRPK